MLSEGGAHTNVTVQEAHEVKEEDVAGLLRRERRNPKLRGGLSEAEVEEVKSELAGLLGRGAASIFGMDAASGAAVAALQLSPSDHVLDLCAAPGGVANCSSFYASLSAHSAVAALQLCPSDHVLDLCAAPGGVANCSSFYASLSAHSAVAALQLCPSDHVLDLCAAPGGVANCSSFYASLSAHSAVAALQLCPSDHVLDLCAAPGGVANCSSFYASLSAHSAVAALQLSPSDHVLDLCAAPGGVANCSSFYASLSAHSAVAALQLCPSDHVLDLCAAPGGVANCSSFYASLSAHSAVAALQLCPSDHVLELCAAPGGVANCSSFYASLSAHSAVAALQLCPSDHVLDLCAAPGAKLCLILDELSSAPCTAQQDVSCSSVPLSTTAPTEIGTVSGSAPDTPSVTGTVTAVDVSPARLAACRPCELVPASSTATGTVLGSAASKGSAPDTPSVTGTVTAVDVSPARLAACRTLLQKHRLTDRCRLFLGDGTAFRLGPPISKPGMELGLGVGSAKPRGTKLEQVLPRVAEGEERAEMDEKAVMGERAGMVGGGSERVSEKKEDEESAGLWEQEGREGQDGEERDEGEEREEGEERGEGGGEQQEGEGLGSGGTRVLGVAGMGTTRVLRMRDERPSSSSLGVGCGGDGYDKQSAQLPPLQSHTQHPDSGQAFLAGLGGLRGIAVVGHGCWVRWGWVLVDAECTHDGSLKHILKYDSWGWHTLNKRFLDPQRLNSLSALQRSLLETGFLLLKPGGRLVYSTCR
ncbi:unnamed protein product [Closterium sp. Naga37s-1]|nr:unnamed protein product [Closterium sp. Naga37s-1]